MTKMIKSAKMRGMNILHFVCMTALMMTAWFNCYSPSLAPENARTINIAVCVCYAVVSNFLYRTYNAYKIGMYHTGETFYAQTLANLFGNGITYVFACLIQVRFINVLPVLLVFIIQTLISGVWCMLASKLHFSLHDPMKTLVIYKDEEDYEKLSEVANYGKRFSIQGTLKDPKDIFEILPNLDGYHTVIISGIDATLRNGIVKACIDKDIDCYFIPHTGDVIIAGAKHVKSFSVPIMRTKRAVLKPEYAFAKRALDIIIAAIGLIIASPFMAVTAIMIKAYDHGPAFYKQVRLTKDGRRFEILNLRWMQVVHELHKIQVIIQDVVCRGCTRFPLHSDFRHSIAGFAGVFAA